MPRNVTAASTPEQVERLLSVCGRGFAGVRPRAIILTLLDCGLRVSELCGLALGDLSWEVQTLRAMGKGSSERVVPFGEATRQVLLSYVARRGDLSGQQALLVTCYRDPLNRREVHRSLEDAGRRASPTGVRCSPRNDPVAAEAQAKTSSLARVRASLEPWSGAGPRVWGTSAGVSGCPAALSCAWLRTRAVTRRAPPGPRRRMGSASPAGRHRGQADRRRPRPGLPRQRPTILPSPLGPGIGIGARPGPALCRRRGSPPNW